MTWDLLKIFHCELLYNLVSYSSAFIDDKRMVWCLANIFVFILFRCFSCMRTCNIRSLSFINQCERRMGVSLLEIYDAVILCLVLNFTNSYSLSYMENFTGSFYQSCGRIKETIKLILKCNSLTFFFSTLQTHSTLGWTYFGYNNRHEATQTHAV